MIELIKQNTYEKTNKTNTSPEALISSEEKHNERRANTKNGTIRNKTEKQNFWKLYMSILQRSKLDTNAKMYRIESELQQMRNERTLRESMQTEIQQQPNSEKTNRRRNERTGRINKPLKRKHPPHIRNQEKKRNEPTFYSSITNQRDKEKIYI